MIEKLLYWLRPLRACKGNGCYVFTPGRVNGEPMCLCCQEDLTTQGG